MRVLRAWTAQWQYTMGRVDALPGYHVSTRVWELHIRDAGYNLREEWPVCRILWLLKHLGVAITESGLQLIGIRIVDKLATSLVKVKVRVTCLMSQSLMVPLLELYTKRLHSLGWNSEAVMTSVSSSMLAGLMSTMLNDWSVISMCHKLILRSSAER